MTKTWSDVVKGLKKDDELETTISGKSGNESEIVDSNKWVDSDEPNFMKAKQTRRYPKSTPKRRSRWVEGCQYRDNKEVEKGLTSKQPD